MLRLSIFSALKLSDLDFNIVTLLARAINNLGMHFLYLSLPRFCFFEFLLKLSSFFFFLSFSLLRRVQSTLMCPSFLHLKRINLDAFSFASFSYKICIFFMKRLNFLTSRTLASSSSSSLLSIITLNAKPFFFCLSSHLASSHD